MQQQKHCATKRRKQTNIYENESPQSRDNISEAFLFSVLLLALSLSPFLVYTFKANRFGSRGMPPLRRSKKGPRYKTEEQEKQNKK